MGASEVASSATDAYLAKGSFWYLAYSHVPRMMGQILTIFFPNRAKPAIRPISTMVKPFMGSPASLMIRMEITITSAELTSVAPTPAIYT